RGVKLCFLFSVGQVAANNLYASGRPDKCRRPVHSPVSRFQSDRGTVPRRLEPSIEPTRQSGHAVGPGKANCQTENKKQEDSGHALSTGTNREPGMPAWSPDHVAKSTAMPQIPCLPQSCVPDQCFLSPAVDLDGR